MVAPAGIATERLFDAAFRAEFADLLAWRRDVRRFRADPVPEATLDALIRLADPRAVGRQQPAGPQIGARSGTRRSRGRGIWPLTLLGQFVRHPGLAPGRPQRLKPFALLSAQSNEVPF
jgi:hypothetical protein